MDKKKFKKIKDREKRVQQKIQKRREFIRMKNKEEERKLELEDRVAEKITPITNESIKLEKLLKDLEEKNILENS